MTIFESLAETVVGVFYPKEKSWEEKPKKRTDLLNPERIDFAYVDEVIKKAQEEPFQNFLDDDSFDRAGAALVRHSAVVHYTSDNGDRDTAGPEIKARLQDARALFQTITGRLGPLTEYHDIPSQDAHAAAFDLAQLARGAVRGFGNVFFVNCAPRKKQRGKEGHNGGETVYAGILPNGAVIAGTGPDVFVHFKDLVKAGQLNLYKVNVATNGTQFRSRDYFPWLAVLIGNHINKPEVNFRWRKDLSLEQRDKILFGLNIVNREEKLAAKDIPELLNNSVFVARSDTHGNLKLGIRHSEIKEAFGVDEENPEVIVYANGRVLKATVVTNSFDKSDGTTVVSGGSSGRWTGADGKQLDPFAEIFTVGGRARDLLAISDSYLKNGVAVHIIPAKLFYEAKEQLATGGKKLKDGEIIDAFLSTGLIEGIRYEGLQKVVAEKGASNFLDNHSVVQKFGGQVAYVS